MTEMAPAILASSQDKDHSMASSEEDRSSLSSDGTQAGVKNIEAVSQTWTHWPLIAAYLG